MDSINWIHVALVTGGFVVGFLVGNSIGKQIMDKLLSQAFSEGMAVGYELGTNPETLEDIVRMTDGMSMVDQEGEDK